jgi:mannan endo-1,4-beta-mannosidase
LLGHGIYDFNHDKAEYTANVKKELDELAAFGKAHKKLIAFTDTGSQQLPFDNWFTTVLWPAIRRYPLCYVLFWRNAWDNPKETYAAHPGSNTEVDFQKFYRYKRTLFIKDIQDK